ncbi:MAG: hypothetical protein M0P70_07990 [Desulfobulbaceae bacterium]|nr:hypothetical protein [Desulfobulbaceae bacterium]
MKKTCDICNGSGQLSSFKGVSRFLLSWEECPQCAGLGYLIITSGDAGGDAPPGNTGQDGNGKTNKNRRGDRS